MRNFTRNLFTSVSLSVLALSVSAQCPNAQGMTATPLSFNGNCILMVQFAHPNGNVSIYNASGYVKDATANAQGIIAFTYNTCIS